MTDHPSTPKRIAVSEPRLDGAEVEYVTRALRAGEVSGAVGEYLARFEREFAVYCGCADGVAVNSGTAALHLALASIGIGRGDEVLVSTLTNMATIFAVLYQGATPVLIDIEEDTWNLDPALLEARVTPRTKAILVVHLFGHPVDMDRVRDVASRHGLQVVEDCAEAHGATYRGARVGGLGDVGCFSFYANKLITTGEGGMLTTNDAGIAARARSLKGLAFGTANKFMHEAVGFSYRMTNVQAAIGCAQLERLDSFIERKRAIAAAYRERLAGTEHLRLPGEKDYARSVYWMYHVQLTGPLAARRDAVMRAMSEAGIETREGFVPASEQRLFRDEPWCRTDDCPRAAAAAYSTFYLPSGVTLDEPAIDRVAAGLRGAMESVG